MSATSSGRNAVLPMDLLGGFVLDTGDTWGAIAAGFQREDVWAILDRSKGAPLRHWLLRGRGMSKTTDIAALVLALLLTEAPPKSHSYAFAVDGDQAQLTMDAIDAIVTNTPGLAGAVEVGARSVTNRRNGALLKVETSDGASSLGLKPWFVIVDELAAWPNTANHRRLWASIVGAIPKVPGARLVVISTAGSPAGLGKRTWDNAEKSDDWHTSKHPGPSPWWTERDIRTTRNDLLPSEWMRYIECEWAEGEDTLTTPEDIAACTRATPCALEPVPGHRYVAALDVGTRRDLTAFSIGHMEQTAAGRKIVIDRVRTWQPTKDNRVDLAEVEAAVRRLCKEYRITKTMFDRMQAEQLSQNLAKTGIRVEEFLFTQASTNRLAKTLATAFRDRSVEVPDDPELQAELLTVRLVETGPGTVKMDNPTGTHDDAVTTVAMVAATLMAQPDYGPGSAYVPTGKVGPRATVTTRERMASPSGQFASVIARSKARSMPRGVRAITGVPGAYDDPRRANP